MRYGNCISHKNTKYIKTLKHIGFDYVETALAPLYYAGQPELSDFFDALGENNIKCEAVNNLFPGDVALTGEKADFGKVESYVSEVFEKTKNLGFKIVVFGSGAARRVPDGFPKERAIGQIIGVINHYLIPAAEKYDFTVAIEELHKGVNNIINTLDEAEYIAEQVNHPRVKIVADLCHIALENTDINAVKKLCGKNLIAHCHISNPYNNYFYPHESDSIECLKLYGSFFCALQSGGYGGRMSIEAVCGGLASGAHTDFPGWVTEDGDKIFYAESKKSLDFMKGLLKSKTNYAERVNL